MTKEKCKAINSSPRSKGSEELKLYGFSDDKLKIEYRCEECESCANDELDAEECNGDGDLVCGGCKCKEGFKGNELDQYVIYLIILLIIYLRYV